MQVIRELLQLLSAKNERLTEAKAKPLFFWPSTSKRPVTVNSALRHHKDQELAKTLRKQLAESPTRKRLEDLLGTSDITKIFAIAPDETTAEEWKDASLVEVPLQDVSKFKLNSIQYFRKPLIVHTSTRGGKDNAATELLLYKHKRCPNVIKIETTIGETSASLLFFVKPEEPKTDDVLAPDVADVPAQKPAPVKLDDKPVQK